MHARASDGGTNVLPAIVWQGSEPYPYATERTGKLRATRPSTSALKADIPLVGAGVNVCHLTSSFYLCEMDAS